jgi:rod shape-determining protein MreC
MESFLSRHKNLIALVIVLAGQVFGLAMQVKVTSTQGGMSLMRLWSISAITPAEKAVVHTQRGILGGWSNYFYLRGVRKENRDLREQIEQMRLEQVRLQQDALQARRLQALFDFKEQFISQTLAAQVIGSSGSDQSRLLYIDKGSDDGVKVDQAVISPDGIVGKILRVLPSTSQVLMINDQLSGVGATMEKTRLQGILAGTPNGTLVIKYIMKDEKIEPGETVVTSGGDRIFPKGLPIGKVAEASGGKDIFLNIRVTPAANLSRIEEVLVVTKIVERQRTEDETNGPVKAADILAERLPSVPQKPAVDPNAKPGTTAAAETPAQAPASTSVKPATAPPATGTAPKPTSTTGTAAAKPAASHVPETSATPGTPATNKPKSTPTPGPAHPSDIEAPQR